MFRANGQESTIRIYRGGLLGRSDHKIFLRPSPTKLAYCSKNHTLSLPRSWPSIFQQRSYSMFCSTLILNTRLLNESAKDY
jgi:hypothetical protein